MTTIGKWEHRRYEYPEPPHPDHGLPYYMFRRIDYVDKRKRVTLHCERADTVERYGSPDEYIRQQGIDELATKRART